MNSQRRGRQRTAGFRYMFHLGQFRFTPPKSGHLQCTSSCPLWTESCTAESRDGANTEKDYSLRRPECANYEVGSQAMPPKVKVEPARLVPRGGTYYEITRRQNRTLSKIYRNSVEFLLLTGPQVKFRTGYGIDPKPQAPADAQNKYGCEEVSSHLGSGGRAVRRRLYPPKADIYDCERHVH